MDDKKRLEELEELERKIKARNKYQNDFQKSRYDRIAVLLPKGYKAIVDNAVKEQGFRTITEYIKALIDRDLKPGGDVGSAPDQEQNFSFSGFSDGADSLPFG